MISDNWPAYHWLSNPESGYYYHVHMHVDGDFGGGADSTSHIEQLWAHLKSIIKNMYHTISNDNFDIFLREGEFRRNFNLLPLDKKWEEILMH